MIILAIESSCDETSASVIVDSQIKSNIISSQYFHQKFGGVIPELASRAHLSNIHFVVKEALRESKREIEELDGLAVTSEPGLLGSLAVGANFAKGLSIRYGKPVVPINHIEGHIFSGCLQEQSLEFPFVTLVVSGGHTSIFFVKSYNDYQVLGSTRDDAAGEAFDKIGTMLGLSYPAGPLIDKLSKTGNSKRFDFPRAMINKPNYDFSFSGLKTSVRYFLHKNYPEGVPEDLLPDLCSSVQQAIIDALIQKTLRAAIDFNVKSIVIGGGVSANSALREQLSEKAKRNNIAVTVPELSYCMDNAAMIAYLAEKKLSFLNKKQFFNLKFRVSPKGFRAKNVS
ncbi:MAG: tRNA (adenosine(37)-N6)-threonylcarbamoyltransferase complex transferase subunit TsaD [Ignavibacteria bacterium]|nr:tRNA (adenosine(37)-N6)-threonylcarbamoyltransferase complex transferase subunit TsaD [Ignavibacteria bacterium]